MAVVSTDSFIPQEDEFAIDSTIDERPSSASAPAGKSGWAAAQATVKPTGDYPEDFKLTETQQVIKIIDTDGPSSIYKLHFLTKEGRRGYSCLGEDCPLCEIGDVPTNKYAFTVAVLEGDTATRMKLVGGVRLFKTFLAADSSKNGPLSNNYWAISKTGAMANVIYTLTPIKSRDIQEDWKINEAAVVKQIAEMKPYTPEQIEPLVSRANLKEIANDLA